MAYLRFQLFCESMIAPVASLYRVNNPGDIFFMDNRTGKVQWGPTIAVLLTNSTGVGLSVDELKKIKATIDAYFQPSLGLIRIARWDTKRWDTNLGSPQCCLVFSVALTSFQNGVNAGLATIMKLLTKAKIDVQSLKQLK